MVVGGVHYSSKLGKELQAKKDEIKIKYETQKPKLDKLEKIEAQNAKLEQLATRLNIQLPQMLKPHDDRGHRRLTSRNMRPGFTAFKKTVNRISVVVGKAGSGILLYRLLPMVAIPLLTHIPFLAHVAFIATVSAAVSVVAWPAVCVALGVGAIWAGIYTYKYIKERKLAASERFLNDVDNRLHLAKKNQKFLVKALGGEPPQVMAKSKQAPTVKKTEEPMKLPQKDNLPSLVEIPQYSTVFLNAHGLKDNLADSAKNKQKVISPSNYL